MNIRWHRLNLTGTVNLWLRIALDTEKDLPPWWQFKRRAFFQGRLCALRECAMALQDEIKLMKDE